MLRDFFNLLVLKNKFSKVARCRINVQKNHICMPLQQNNANVKIKKTLHLLCHQNKTLRNKFNKRHRTCTLKNTK